ncbi:alpha/beta hydrolase [Haliangium ochraceum]|nr:alpha/beta hydrolase [Haliangium ochraceum]
MTHTTTDSPPRFSAASGLKGPRLRTRERAMHRLARLLCAVPAPLQEALTGGPIERGGRRFASELLLVRALSERAGLRRPASARQLRQQQNLSARIGGGPADQLETRELWIDGEVGALRARHYVCEQEHAPLVVFFHGGGFVFGDVDTHDAPCRLLCRHAGVHVLSVEYRLAPEHRFPAAVGDGRAALRWAHEHASALGADPARVAVAGDSAGANLAAVVAHQAARDGGPAPVAQILVYPPLDRRSAWPSLSEFASGFYLTRDAIDWFHAQYVGSDGHDATRDDPRLNPMRAGDLSALAPALVITAGFDPLRDEGEAYADALERAGNLVKRRCFDSLPHGFFNMVGISPVCRSAVIALAEDARALFAEAVAAAEAQA